MIFLSCYYAFVFGLAALALAWYPCCCAGLCLVGTDDFERASIGDGWVADAGSWSIASEVLQTTSANGRLEYQTPHPESIASAIVTVQVKGSASGDCLRIWLTTDLFVELEVETNGFGYLRLYDNSGEIAETRVEGATLSTWHSLIGCYHYGDGRISERLSGHFIPGETGFTTQVYTQERYVIDGGTGNYVGLATGSLTGTASFDTFEFQAHESAGQIYCPNCLECEIWTPWSPASGTGSATDAWNQVSGTWTYASGEPLKTDSADAKVVSRVTHSSDSYDSQLTCTIDSADDNIVKVYLPYGTGDADSVYASIKFHASTGQVKLYDGATLLSESDFSNTSGPQDVTFCVNNGYASIKVGDLALIVSFDLLAQTTGRVFGFASADASAGTTISAIVWERTRSDYAECVMCGTYDECSFCINDNIARYVVISVDGVMDGVWCDSCEEMNGSYLQETHTGALGNCWYTNTFWVPTCVPPPAYPGGDSRFAVGYWRIKTGVTDPYILDEANATARGVLRVTRPYYEPSLNVGWRITLTAEQYINTPYRAILADSAGHYKWSSGAEYDINCLAPRSLAFVGQCDEYFSGSPRQVCDFTSSTVDIIPW